MFQSIQVGEVDYPEAVLIGVFDDKIMTTTDSPLFTESNVVDAIASRECTGEKGNLIETFTLQNGMKTRIYIGGLGKREKLTSGDLRNLGASFGRRLSQTHEENVTIDLAGSLASSGANIPRCGRCFGEGIGLLGWNYTRFNGSASKAKARSPLTMQCSDLTFQAGMELGLRLATSTNMARDLSQTPPNVATPIWMAEQAKMSCLAAMEKIIYTAATIQTKTV